jgi:hypothetical protein
MADTRAFVGWGIAVILFTGTVSRPCLVVVVTFCPRAARLAALLRQCLPVLLALTVLASQRLQRL